MPHRLLVIPDAFFYVVSAISGSFAFLGWVIGQVVPGADAVNPAPVISGGTLFAGIVAIITACSPLVLGAMDRKGLRRALAAANAALARQRDRANSAIARANAQSAQWQARARMLERYLVEQANADKVDLPPWYFDGFESSDMPVMPLTPDPDAFEPTPDPEQEEAR